MNQILENWELKSQFSEDEVFRVEGILDVNTIEYFPCPKTLPNVSGAFGSILKLHVCIYYYVLIIM